MSFHGQMPPPWQGAGGQGGQHGPAYGSVGHRHEPYNHHPNHPSYQAYQPVSHHAQHHLGQFHPQHSHYYPGQSVGQTHTHMPPPPPRSTPGHTHIKKEDPTIKKEDAIKKEEGAEAKMDVKPAAAAATLQPTASSAAARVLMPPPAPQPQAPPSAAASSCTAIPSPSQASAPLRPKGKGGPYVHLKEPRSAGQTLQMFADAKKRREARGRSDRRADPRIGGVGVKREIGALGQEEEDTKKCAHVVFVLDGSGSMRERDARDERGTPIIRCDAVFKCCIDFVTGQLADAEAHEPHQGIREPDIYSIIRFNDSADVLLEAAPLDHDLLKTIRGIRSAFKPRSGTHFGPAFRELASVTARHAHSTNDLVVVLLSDGRPGDLCPNSTHVQPALHAMCSFYEQVPASCRLLFHAVTISNEVGADMYMRLFARVMDGQYHESSINLATDDDVVIVGVKRPTRSDRHEGPAAAASSSSSGGGGAAARRRVDAAAVVVAGNASAWPAPAPKPSVTTLSHTFTSISRQLTSVRSSAAADQAKKRLRTDNGGLEARDAWRLRDSDGEKTRQVTRMAMKTESDNEISFKPIASDRVAGCSRTVTIRRKAFSQGALRLCFHMWDAKAPAEVVTPGPTTLDTQAQAANTCRTCTWWGRRVATWSSTARGWVSTRTSSAATASRVNSPTLSMPSSHSCLWHHWTAQPWAPCPVGPCRSSSSRVPSTDWSTRACSAGSDTWPQSHTLMASIASTTGTTATCFPTAHMGSKASRPPSHRLSPTSRISRATSSTSCATYRVRARPSGIQTHRCTPSPKSMARRT